MGIELLITISNSSMQITLDFVHLSFIFAIGFVLMSGVFYVGLKWFNYRRKELTGFSAEQQDYFLNAIILAFVWPFSGIVLPIVLMIFLWYKAHKWRKEYAKIKFPNR